MIRSKISKTHIKLFLLSSLVLTGIFLFLGYLMLSSIERYAFQEKMKRLRLPERPFSSMGALWRRI